MEDQQDNRYLRDCLHRFTGHCRGCKRDYSREHHPNNIDCPMYKEISLLIIEIKPRILNNGEKE